MITGQSDLWEPAEEIGGINLMCWDHERDGNLQDKRGAEWLGHHDPRAGACLDAEHPPVVLAARATPFGGAEIDLSGGCRLTLFPAGSAGEDWRLFRPGGRRGRPALRDGGRPDRGPRIGHTPWRGPMACARACPLPRRLADHRSTMLRQIGAATCSLAGRLRGLPAHAEGVARRRAGARRAGCRGCWPRWAGVSAGCRARRP